MKGSSLAIISIITTLAFAPAVMAQEQNPGANEPSATAPELGRVEQGNKTIVFAAADNSDLEVSRLRTWGDFAAAHPNVAKALAYNPSLMNNDGYLAKHPDLEAFFGAHPDVEKSMAANPGNYNAIPPRPGE
jgi:hypothetical protein